MMLLEASEKIAGALTEILKSSLAMEEVPDDSKGGTFIHERQHA